MSNWQYFRRWWLSLFVFWVVLLPLGLLTPMAVIASTIVCVTWAVMLPALVLIWGQ